MPWFVLYTKSRNEKLVAERLHTRGIEVYCPMINVRRRWSDRVKMIQKPLFPSYCFVRLAEKERANVFGVPGVVRYLFWQKQAAIVRDVEIDAIRLMLNEIDNMLIQVKTYQPGDILHIGSGSFMDVSGTVVRQQGKIVTIILDAMQLMLTVDLSKTIVKA